MDRFIVAFTNPRTKMITDLKSNMDRFIEKQHLKHTADENI